MKRGNIHGQLRREEVEALNDAEEEEEQSSTFQRASAEELSKRRIVKIKRSAPVGNTDTPVSFNPFTSGVPPVFPAPTSNSLSTSALPNPFANFSGLAAPQKSVDTSESLKSAPAATAVVSNGAKTVENPNAAEFSEKLKNLNKSFFQWVTRQIKEHPFSLWTDGLKDYIKYYESLIVKYGMEASTTSNSLAASSPPPQITDDKPSLSKPLFSLSAPAQGTKVEQPSFGVAPSSAPIPPTTTAATKPSTATSFTFPSSTTLESFKPPATTTTTATSELKFGAPIPPVAAPSTTSFNFSGSNSFASNTSFSTTSFTAPPSFSTSFPAVPSFGGFGAGTSSFSSSFMSGNTATTGFGGGFAGTATSTTAAAGGDDGDDGEGEPILEPERAIRNENDTDEILHEAPCKLFGYDKASSEWKDTGKGTFRITRSPDTQKQRMLVRNIIGKITFNAGFYKNMEITVQEGKKASIQFAAFVAVEETVKDPTTSLPTTVTKTELKTFMIKLKPTDVAQTAAKIRDSIASL